MKILGISGSPRKADRSGVHKLVQTVLDNTGFDYDFVSLKGKTIAGCIACLGCVKDNICKVEDDLFNLRDKIVEADAYVVGAPNYYSTFNATTHAFLERWFQFRHQEGDTLWGKLGVAVGVGGTSGQFPADEIEKFFLYNFVETVAKVTGQGAASCYTCGHGETCKVGIPHLLHGEGFKITDDIIPDVTKQPEVITSAVEAGKLLGQRLGQEHDRMAVTKKMQGRMMAMFESAV
ncbi:MAG: flavodoxin family protein [Desulfobacterales bacterium]|nr:MAG: flavodoxin family protein [Desulfobacterales bacterium]